MGETKTTTVLRMIFSLENGKTGQWNLTNPDATKATRVAVDGIMNEIIEDQFFLKDDSEATEIKDSYIYQTNKIDLA